MTKHENDDEVKLMPSFYTPHLKKTDLTLTIDGEEFHHIFHVFRKRIADNILLTNGSGLLAEAEIISLEKKQLSVKIGRLEEKQKSFPAIAAAFPLLKNKHDLLIVEKLTELGISEFYPLDTARTVRLASESTIKKFEKAAIAAIKQCDNAFLPTIRPVQKPAELMENLTTFQAVAALETGQYRTLSSVLREMENRSICLIIGPEGGFTAEEMELFQQKIPTFTLGNHILRSETAAIAAAAIISEYLLDKNEKHY